MECIRCRGMHYMLAQRIQRVLRRVEGERNGELSLEFLRDCPTDVARGYLLSMEGYGVKTVSCILLLALYRADFPVDVNVGRIMARLGWVPLETEEALEELSQYAPEPAVYTFLRERLNSFGLQTLFELHYHMITLGKVFCEKRTPNCAACPLRDMCEYASPGGKRQQKESDQFGEPEPAPRRRGGTGGDGGTRPEPARADAATPETPAPETPRNANEPESVLAAGAVWGAAGAPRGCARGPASGPGRAGRRLGPRTRVCRASCTRTSAGRARAARASSSSRRRAARWLRPFPRTTRTRRVASRARRCRARRRGRRGGRRSPRRCRSPLRAPEGGSRRRAPRRRRDARERTSRISRTPGTRRNQLLASRQGFRARRREAAASHAASPPATAHAPAAMSATRAPRARRVEPPREMIPEALRRRPDVDTDCYLAVRCRPLGSAAAARASVNAGCEVTPLSVLVPSPRGDVRKFPCMARLPDQRASWTRAPRRARHGPRAPPRVRADGFRASGHPSRPSAAACRAPRWPPRSRTARCASDRTPTVGRPRPLPGGRARSRPKRTRRSGAGEERAFVESHPAPAPGFFQPLFFRLSPRVRAKPPETGTRRRRRRVRFPRNRRIRPRESASPRTRRTRSSRTKTRWTSGGTCSWTERFPDRSRHERHRGWRTRRKRRRASRRSPRCPPRRDVIPDGTPAVAGVSAGRAAAETGAEKEKGGARRPRVPPGPGPEPPNDASGSRTSRRSSRPRLSDDIATRFEEAKRVRCTAFRRFMYVE